MIAATNYLANLRPVDSRAAMDSRQPADAKQLEYRLQGFADAELAEACHDHRGVARRLGKEDVAQFDDGDRGAAANGDPAAVEHADARTTVRARDAQHLGAHGCGRWLRAMTIAPAPQPHDGPKRPRASIGVRNRIELISAVCTIRSTSRSPRNASPM